MMMIEENREILVAHVRMKDMRNLFISLFVEFVPNDPLHQIDVYKGLGYALGEHLIFFRENKDVFPDDLQHILEQLDQKISVFLQNLVDIINPMGRSLEPPKGNIEQNSEFYLANISPLIDEVQQELEKICPAAKLESFSTEYEAQESQTENPQKKYLPIWLVLLVAMILALITRHYLYGIDTLGVFVLAFFYAVMFWKIESRFD